MHALSMLVLTAEKGWSAGELSHSTLLVFQKSSPVFHGRESDCFVEKLPVCTLSAVLSSTAERGEYMYVLQKLRKLMALRPL